MSELRAKDVMESDVISVNSDDNLQSVSELFSSQQITGAPVVNESGALVGVISQSDLLHFVSSDGESRRPENAYYIEGPFWYSELISDSLEKLQGTIVAELMSPEVVSVGPDDRVGDVAITMRRKHIHRVIVTEEGKVVGIITALDLLKILENH